MLRKVPVFSRPRKPRLCLTQVGSRHSQGILKHSRTLQGDCDTFKNMCRCGRLLYAAYPPGEKAHHFNSIFKEGHSSPKVKNTGESTRKLQFPRITVKPEHVELLRMQSKNRVLSAGQLEKFQLGCNIRSISYRSFSISRHPRSHSVRPCSYLESWAMRLMSLVIQSNSAFFKLKKYKIPVDWENRRNNSQIG